MVGKKGGSSTPVPMWKTNTSSSPSVPTQRQQQQQQHHTKPLLHSSGSMLPSKDKELSVSARKLAATLWEINDLPPSRVKKEFEVDPMRGCKEKVRSREKKGVGLSRSGLLRPQMSDPSHSPASEVNFVLKFLFYFIFLLKFCFFLRWFIGCGVIFWFVQRMKGLEGDNSCKRRVSGFSHQLLSGDYYLDALDAHSSANFIEVKSEFLFIRPN